MKKLILALVTVLVVAALALPYALGRLTQLQVEARAAALSDAGIVAVEIKSYERGWFRSHAQIGIGLAPAYVAQIMAAQTRQTVPVGLLERHASLAIDFAHGPVAVLDGVHFGLSKMVVRLDPSTPGLADFLAQLGIPYLFEFRGHTSFSGALAFDADMPAIDRPAGDATFNFSGGTLDGKFANNHLQATGNIASVRFGSTSGGLVLENLHADVNNDVLSYVMPGKASFSIEHVTVVQGSGAAPAIDAANLRLEGDTTVDAGGALMASKISYSVGSLAAADMRLADVALTIGLRNIDVAAFRSYVQAAQGVAANSGGDPRAALAALGPAVERALEAGPVFTIEPLQFRLDDEPFAATVELAANPQKLPPAGAIDLADPALWLTILHGNANIDLSKKLAQRLAGLAALARLGGDDALSPQEQRDNAEAQAGLGLVMLVGQGVLVENGDHYTTKLDLTDGHLTLNGQLLPFGLP